MDASSRTERPPEPFGLPPVVAGDWRELSEPLEAALRLRFDDARLAASGARVERVRVLALPFFPGWMLCDMRLGEVGSAAETEIAAQSVLYGPDGFTPLDRFETVERHVEMHGIRLETASACMAYVWFAVAFGALGTVSVDLPSSVGAGEGPEGMTLDFAGRPEPTPFDGVRAPEAARIDLRAVQDGRRVRLGLRLAADGEITELGREDLGPAGEPAAPVRRDGAMRYAPRETGGEAA